MEISKNTIDILSQLNKFSGDKIKNQNDIAFLIEISHSENNNQLFNDLMFTAKYLNGLGKILHTGLTNIKINKANPESKETLEHNSINKIRNEYKLNLEKFIKQLEGLLENLRSEDIINFKNKHLASTQLSMVNLTNLIYDISWVKKFYNRNKH